MLNRRFLVTLFALALVLPAFAQDDRDREQIANPNDVPPVYRVNVVERTTQAVDYRHKGHTVDLDLVGTSLMPEAHGNVSVEPHTGRVNIKADFKSLRQPQTFGPQYLTYVLWAITPEGRPENLGEVVLTSHKDKDADLRVSSSLQSFGLIVTAEPYFAVTHPSDLVVMENAIRRDTKADIRPISTRYDALAKTEYSVDITPADLPTSRHHEQNETPRELMEAENAIAIAKATGADHYAAASLQKAEDAYHQADNAYRQKAKAEEIGTPAKLATQTAEDARVMTIRAKREEKLAEERRLAKERTEEARARAEAESQRAEQARVEADRAAADRAKAEADREAAERARQDAELARQQAVDQQQQLAQQAEAARLQAQQAEQGRQQAEANAQETRQRLLNQLNSVLQTRESARGLIVNMSDVLFDTGKATLKPGARERLAKIAGIVMAYPDLKLDVGGYTDNVGSDEFNQRLSERRADTVRSFLVSQGVPQANIISEGHGESQPIASNETASGRQLNRRVELVVSGNAIGTSTVGETTTSPATPTGIAAPASTTPPPHL
jgi:outer membrane protein OmpA-like peptidoglycan-associated protein